MSRQPRDPTVTAILRATVRVGGGSGVVVRSGRNAVIATAHHVVERDGPHRVRWGAEFKDVDVLHSNAEADLAILAAPPQIENFALTVAGPGDDAAVGDDVWASGFPRGWSGDQPVLAKGTIAAFGPPANWLNIGGTWGNSGGPLCRSGASEPTVNGLLLGRAGESNDELEDLLQKTRNTASGLDELAVVLERELHREDPDTPEWEERNRNLEDVSGLALHARGIEAVADLLDQHFRTGFLRFAAASDLRKLLA